MNRHFRFLLHPVMGHPRSRFIFLCFTTASVIAMAFLWWKALALFRSAGLFMPALPSDGNPVLRELLLPYLHLGVTFAAAILASGLTAKHVVGPFKRIEEWLVDWEAGRSIAPLSARHGDDYENLVRLINDLRQQSLDKSRRRPGA